MSDVPPKRDTDPYYKFPPDILDRFLDSQRPPAGDVKHEVVIPKASPVPCPLCVTCPVCRGTRSVSVLVAAEFVRCQDIDLTKEPEEENG